jgi:Kef-type K+ transport system membrane component KefB
VKEYIFAPFFFASIGFAVPFLDLWHGQVLWQGVLYALLMIFGKIITGVWIIIWTYVSPRWKKPVAGNVSSTVPVCIVQTRFYLNSKPFELINHVIDHASSEYQRLDVSLSSQSVLVYLLREENPKTGHRIKILVQTKNAPKIL